MARRQNGQLGIPPGPGLGVDLKEEFVRGQRVTLHSVDESLKH